MTGKCVDFLAQQKQDNRESIQGMKRDRQAFDQEMENTRRRNQEQQQQFVKNMWDIFSPPNGPGKPIKTESDTIQRPSVKESKCGNLYTVQQLGKLRNWHAGLAKKWKKNSLSAYGFLFFQTNVGLSGYLKNPRYDKNVRVWQDKVRCYDKCSNAIPMKNGKTNGGAKQFQNCTKKCRQIKYDYT